MDLKKYVNVPKNNSKEAIDNFYLQLAQEELRSHPIGSSAFTKRIKKEYQLSENEAVELRTLFDDKVPAWQNWAATIFSEMSQIKQLPAQLVSLLMMQVREIIYCHHGKFQYNLAKSVMQSASECFLEGIQCPRENCDGCMKGCNYQCADLICNKCGHMVEIKMRSRISTRQKGETVINFGIPEGVKRWHQNGTLVLFCKGGILQWDAHNTCPNFPENVGSVDEVVDTRRKTDVSINFSNASYLWSEQSHQKLRDWNQNRSKYANIMGTVLARFEASLSGDKVNHYVLLKKAQKQVNAGLRDFLQLIQEKS